MTTAVASRPSRKPSTRRKPAAPPHSVALRPHDSIPRPNAARFLTLPLEERRRRLLETRKALGPFLPSSEEFRAEQRAEAARED